MMLMNPEQEALIARVFEAYVTEHHHADILQLIADTNEEIHYPVVVNAMTLFEANMEVMSTCGYNQNDIDNSIFPTLTHHSLAIDMT